MLASSSGCNLVFSPQKVYDTAWEELKRGDLELALRDADRGLRRYPSPNTQWHWRFRVLKAEVLVWQHRNEESLALSRQDLPASLAHTDLAVWRRLSQTAASAYTQQLPDAERYLAEAEALAQAYQPELLGQVALRRGTVLFWENKTIDAQRAYREALQLARQEKEPFLEAASLGSLSVVAAKQEHYDESVDWGREALKLSESIGAKSSVSRILGNMGWSLRELGDFDSALSDYKQAEQASARNGQVGDQIYWLTGISSVYYQQHDYAAAQAVLEQAFDFARQQDDKTIIIEYLNDLAELAVETGKIDAAEKYYKQALAIQRVSNGQDWTATHDTTLIRARIEATKLNYAEAEKFFRQLINEPQASTAQRWEAHARLAMVYRGEGLATKAEEEFRGSLATVELARSSLQAEDLRLSFLATAISCYDDYIEFLLAQHRVEDALHVAELSRARTLAEGLGAAAAKLQTLPVPGFYPRQIAQHSNAALLFYWLGQKKSYLWVITPAKVSCLTLPGATQIDLLVKSYREVVLSGRDVLETHAADGARLYNILVEPAEKLIPQGSRVILLPDGSLHGLNFETLIVSEPKPHFWIEDITVSTASSLTLLSGGKRASSSSAGILPARQQDDAAVSGGNLLLVGNAVQASPEFPVLRHAETEMARIQHYFPESAREVLTGPRATPAAFLASKPEKFAYVHFVTHGTASRAHPLDSALILSPQGDSYKLYARDIVKHPLSAYLVTVSACAGSGTRAYSGEGLVGLSWAFLRAGAHNVISALWEVSDASTPQLMDRLYGELSRGQDPASALRTAKLSLLKSDSVFKKPFYWAPFQLYSGS